MQKSQSETPTVLLVDDDHADQEIIRRIVAHGGMRATLAVASSGPEALDFLAGTGGAARKVDLILLDLNMPGLSGLQTLQRMRSRPETRTTPIVVLSTSDSESDVIRSYEQGANSYITKPVSFDEFIRVVREIDEYWFDVAVLPSAAGP